MRSLHQSVGRRDECNQKVRFTDSWTSFGFTVFYICASLEMCSLRQSVGRLNEIELNSSSYESGFH